MQLILVLFLLAGWIYFLNPEAKANMAPFYPDDPRFKEPARKVPGQNAKAEPQENAKSEKKAKPHKKTKSDKKSKHDKINRLESN